MIDLGDSCFETTTTPLPEAPWRASPALLHAGFAHDPDVPVAALGARPGARVFVADAHGGAESALAHLAAGASRVVAATTQDPDAFAAILRLKAAAHRRLPRPDALRLLGLLRASFAVRLALFDAVAGALPADDRAFWNRHADALGGGLFNVSAEVALGRLLRDLLRAHLPRDVYRALLYGDRAEREATFASRLDRPGFWRHAVRLCALRGRLADHGDDAVGTFTRGEPMDALRRLVRVGLPSSPVWSRAFCNDAGVLAVLPAHLLPEGHGRLRAHLDGLELRADPPRLALAAEPDGVFDGIDLGNAPDYLDAPSRRWLLLEVARVARPGARVVVASLDPLGLRALAPASFVSLPGVDEALAERDRAPVWGRWSVFTIR
jgi:hypothetical protein